MKAIISNAILVEYNGLLNRLKNVALFCSTELLPPRRSCGGLIENASIFSGSFEILMPRLSEIAPFEKF